MGQERIYEDRLETRLAKKVPSILGDFTIREYLDAHPKAWKIIRDAGERAAKDADSERMHEKAEMWRIVAMLHEITELLTVHADSAAISKVKDYWRKKHANSGETI